MVWPEDQIPIDDKAHQQPEALGQCGLDIHVTSGYLLPDLINTALQAITARDDDAITILTVLWRRQLSADTQKRRQRSTCENAVPVPIDTILQPGVASRIRASQLSSISEDVSGKMMRLHTTCTRPVQDIDSDVRLNRAFWMLADALRQLKA